ncbi:MAG: hypothetical protein AAF385_01565 [Pseudomonadota bacterium]
MLLRPLLTAVFVCLLIACKHDPTLKPFSSDGCSLFPDSALLGDEDWCTCCFEHDLAYWRGGDKAERKQADERLRDCVELRTGDKAFASTMYLGVRAGGSAYFPTWYRWGYGWKGRKKYLALSPVENAQADKLLKRFPPQPELVCPTRSD